MYRICIAILFCAEYDFEKLKKHWREPESPEEILIWNLKLGIAKCILIFIYAEKYVWNKPKNDRHIYSCGQKNKKPPTKLLRILFRIINNPNTTQTKIEQIAKLRAEIRDIIIYIQKIKNDKNYLNAATLQNIYKCLNSLLELKISPTQSLSVLHSTLPGSQASRTKIEKYNHKVAPEVRDKELP